MATDENNPYKTSKKDFEYFKKRCKHWMDVFGMRHFDIIYEHGNELRGEAGVMWQDSHLSGKIMLAKEMNAKPRKELLNWYALHEVLHIMLNDITLYINRSMLTPNEINRLGTAEHAVINRILNVMLGELE